MSDLRSDELAWSSSNSEGLWEDPHSPAHPAPLIIGQLTKP